MSMRLAEGEGELREVRKGSTLIVVLICLAIAIIAGLTISSLYREKQRYLQASNIKTSAQAQLLGESATSVLYDVDLTLLATKHLLENETVETATFPQSVQHFILAQMRFLPQMTGVAFVSPAGELVYRSGNWADSALPSLIPHRDGWLELYVGTTRPQGDGSRILLSRRVENRDGEFVGVLAAEIAPEFFNKRYADYLGIDVAAIVLFDIEGAVLSGWYNDRDRRDKLTGISLKDVSLFSSLAQSLPLAGGLQAYENAESIVFSFQLTGFPFHIAVASRKDLVLANWYAESRKNLAIIAFSTLLAGAATVLAWSHRKKRWNAENKLLVHQLHLEETVGERTREISLMNNELLQKNEALRQAMAEIKTLSGYLPICSHCKKIRDDSGYWNQLEAYICSRTETEFSHGICPDCAREHYPDVFIDD